MPAHATRSSAAATAGKAKGGVNRTIRQFLLAPAAESACQEADRKVKTPVALDTHQYLSNKKVTVCNDPETAAAWIRAEVSVREAGTPAAVGLDCEWSPPWFRGDSPERIDVLQMATEQACLVFQVHHLTELPSELCALLADPGCLKVGVNVQGDCARLARDFGVSFDGAYDLVEASNGCEGKATKGRSLADMVKAYLGFEIGGKDGGPRLGNWSQWPLTESQVQYAAVDAFLSFDVYAKGPEYIRAGPTKAGKPPSDEEEEENSVLQPSNGQKRKGAREDAGGQAAKAARAVSTAKRQANHDFFIGMRNRSIEPPLKGKKSYPEKTSDALSEYCFVVSGVLDSMEREECHEYIRRHGGSVAKSISGKVTHVLHDHGEIGPSKVKKARDRGIPVVGENFLLKLVDPEWTP